MVSSFGHAGSTACVAQLLQAATALAVLPSVSTPPHTPVGAEQQVAPCEPAQQHSGGGVSGRGAFNDWRRDSIPPRHTQRGRHATQHHLQHVSRHSPASHANADQLDQVADDGDLVLQGANSSFVSPGLGSCCQSVGASKPRQESSGDRGMSVAVLILTMVSTTLDAVMSTSRAPKVTATAAGLSSVLSQAAASLSVVWDRVSCSLAFTSSEAARTATRRAGRGATAAASKETPSQKWSGTGSYILALLLLLRSPSGHGRSVRVHASPVACMSCACVGRANTISCPSRSPEGRATATRLVGLHQDTDTHHRHDQQLPRPGQARTSPPGDLNQPATPNDKGKRGHATRLQATTIAVS